MLPFSKRPPPPEEYFLRSGDFQALSPNGQGGMSQSGMSHAIPAAPRAPVFARQASATPYGYAQPQAQASGQYRQYGDLSGPPPPHSLAPVAMGPDSRSNPFAATGTGSLPSLMSTREKPSLKWGVMIALTGALLGGVLGLGMDARRQSARAAAAAEAKEASAQAVAPTPAPVAPPVTNGANALASNVNPPPPVTVTTAPSIPVPVVIPPQSPVIVTPAKADPAAKDKHPKAVASRPAFHGGGGSIAMKVSKPAPEPKADEPKVTKADPPAVKPAAPVKPASGTSEAQKVLEAANKDTTNTL